MAKNASNKIQLQLSPEMREQDKDIAAFLAASTERNTNIMRDALTVYMALSTIDPRLPRTLAGAHYEGIPADSILHHINNMAALNGVQAVAPATRGATLNPEVLSSSVEHQEQAPAVQEAKSTASPMEEITPEIKADNQPEPAPVPESSTALDSGSDVESFRPNTQKTAVKAAVKNRHKAV